MKSDDTYVPDGWELRKIGEISELIKEQVKADNIDTEKYIGLEHIGQGTLNLIEIGSSSAIISNKYRFRKGQILFGKLRPYFRKVVKPLFDGVCSTDIWVIDKKENTDVNFLFYLFASEYVIKEATNSSTGTRMPRASWDYISNLFRAIPPTDEQEKIGMILFDLDEKIRINQSINSILENVAKGLFRHWFVEFEFPDEEGKPYRSNGGIMKPSPKGQIPEEWNITILGDVVELEYGKSLPDKKRKPGNIAVFGSNGQVGWHDEKIAEGPGIIIGRKGNPGIVKWSQYDFYPIDTTFYVKPIEKIKSIYYLYFELINQKLPSLTSDTAVPGLNRNIAYQNNIIVPSSNIIEQFDKIIKPLFDLVYNLEKESEILYQLRDFLLPRLMSGEIRVPLGV